jgi:hydroxyacylglutathione hydrolase
MKTRREFLQNVGGMGVGALCLQAGSALAVPAKSSPAEVPDGLIFETVRTDGLAHLSYFLGDRRSGKAAVLDPRRDVEVYLDLARRHGFQITHAVETHIHADFVSGSRELAHRSGSTEIFVSAEGGARYGFPHRPLHDGDRLELGELVLTALHTPGHTPEHMAYVAAERGRPNQPWGFFSGDFLFADSVGRPDLLGVEHTDRLAKQLFRSVRTRLNRLGDDVRLYPAHGAGSPCGANICDRQSTVGHERRHNRALQFTDEAGFIKWVLETAPPIPRYYPRMKKVNAHGPELLKVLSAIPALKPKAFLHAAEGGEAQLVDNRHMLAFAGGHVAGALNIGPKADLSLWAGWMLDPARPILLVLPRDADLAEVAHQLARVGFTNIEGYLAGGMDAWLGAGLSVQALPLMTVHALKKSLPAGDLQVVDVRTPTEWEGGHVPGARYLFLPELPQKLDRLDRERPVVTYCASGYRSGIAASLLQARGFTKVYNVPGSWKAWTAAGYPVEQPHEHKKASDTDR